MGAVGIHPMAVDNSWQYRPHDKPVSKRLGAVRSMRSVLCEVFATLNAASYSLPHSSIR
jgi:hypothetical protein